MSFKDGKDNDGCGFALLGLLEPHRHPAVEARRQGLALATKAAGDQRNVAPHADGATAPDPRAELQIEALWAHRQRRHRTVNPHAAANALALQHRDIAQTVAANISRRTGHPRDDLEQIAMIGILQAARRFSPERGSFRPYARNYANGEVYHYLRDKGFLIKVPASWRELHARGIKLMRLGVEGAEVLRRYGVSSERWEEIVVACSQKVVAMEALDQG